MARVKICGITREADLRAAVRAGADAVGVVSGVTVDTPREVDEGRAARLAAAAPPFVSTVLVSMPADADEAVDRLGRVGADAIQVHGDLDADVVAEVRERSASRVVVAVDHADVSRARDLDGVADALLVDSTTPEGGGGTGRTHDWDTTRNLARELDTPVILAGGLTPENVAEAAGTVRPYAVDVASGVEASGGVKDHEAVRTFVREAGRSLDDRAPVGRGAAGEPSRGPAGDDSAADSGGDGR